MVLLGGRREIGLATLANMVLIGVFIDLMLLADPLAELDQRALAVRLLAGVAGTVIAGVGLRALHRRGLRDRARGTR